jgi:hypothetical protein
MTVICDPARAIEALIALHQHSCSDHGLLPDLATPDHKRGTIEAHMDQSE